MAQNKVSSSSTNEVPSSSTNEVPSSSTNEANKKRTLAQTNKKRTPKQANKRGTTTPRRTMGSKAGVIFPCARIGRYIRETRVTPRVGAGAAVYLSTILEYLSAEILELAGNVAIRFGKKRIIPRHL